jgi:hypothetical protein
MDQGRWRGARDFFGKFERECRVVSERVQFEKRLAHRKLEDVLAPMQKTPLRSPNANNPEFSFKKVDPHSTANTKNTTETTDKLTYYLQQPKYRLRKFQSAAALRTSISQRGT